MTGKGALANGRAAPPKPAPAPAPAAKKAAPEKHTDEFLAEVQMSADFEVRPPLSTSGRLTFFSLHFLLWSPPSGTFTVDALAVELN